MISDPERWGSQGDRPPAGTGGRRLALPPHRAGHGPHPEGVDPARSTIDGHEVGEPGQGVDPEPSQVAGGELHHRLSAAADVRLQPDGGALHLATSDVVDLAEGVQSHALAPRGERRSGHRPNLVLEDAVWCLHLPDPDQLITVDSKVD